MVLASHLPRGGGSGGGGGGRVSQGAIDGASAGASAGAAIPTPYGPRSGSTDPPTGWYLSTA